MGAGILPIAIVNGTIFFLFGKETYDKKWGDFGGSPIKPESPFETAIREGYEELDGFFGTKSELKKIVKENFSQKFVSDKKYYSYLFEIQHDPWLPVYFNNHHKFIKEHLPHKINKNGLFEKSEIKWFSLNEIKQNKTNFRSHYINILDQIIKDYKDNKR